MARESVGTTPDEYSDSELGETVLEATGISKTYNSRTPFGTSVEVLNDASIRVQAGEIVGIMGENGSGKSTLMGILAGILNADTGTINRPEQIGWCPQEPRLYERLTVEETFNLFGRAYGMDESQIAASRSWLADVLDFERFRDRQIRRLSGGNKQKINLAVALMHEPDLLLLDEPYTGFDWETFLAFWDLADDLRNRGIGIAVISHIINEHDRFDVVYELREGGLHQQRPVDDHDENAATPAPAKGETPVREGEQPVAGPSEQPRGTERGGDE